MANVNTRPKLSKNRKLGKNKKKSWRASNVDDIEEFLEDERRQIRTGGLVAEKTDESLFVLDTSRNTDGDQEPERKRRRRNKPLKSLSLLEPDPYSKTVRKPDKPTFQKGQRKQRILDRLRAKEQSKVRQEAAKQRQTYLNNKKVQQEIKNQLPVVKEDLWSDGDGVALKPSKRAGKKPSALRATVIPHPGASVNPSCEDHQDLLYRANVTEVQKLKKERKIYNALEAKFPSKDEAPTKSTFLEEMSAGLIDDSDEEEEEEDDEGAALSLNPPVRREDRKTKKQKKVEKEEEDSTRQKSQENKIKRKENMILRIPTLKSEIAQEERKRIERAAKRQRMKAEENFKTKRLGKIKYEEPDLDLKLSDELVASLREIKPEGHLLSDVYKSLQRRNVIEPRVRQKKKRKYKLKTFEKKGHKAVTL